jgi:N-acetylglucosaminyl-diphospho-decaprenol L-rhamnosyltransferase
MPVDFEVPIVTWDFGHSEDIVTAIGAQRRCPKLEVFICENGGAAAFHALEKALSEKGGPCEGGVESAQPASNDFVRTCRLRLARGRISVTIGQARDNFGFAGGADAWVRPPLAEPGWDRGLDFST